MSPFTVKALEVGLEENLQEFHAVLTLSHIPHRISEENNTQVVWVNQPDALSHVVALYQDWKAQRIGVRPSSASPVSVLPKWHIVIGHILPFPVTTLFLLLSFIGAILVGFDTHGTLIDYFTFQTLRAKYTNALSGIMQHYEIWRLITPIFLHFGIGHILFNSLWLWELGRRIELIHGHIALLCLILLSGIASNITQFAYQHLILFGGMSGVIYALLGYIWSWNNTAGRAKIPLPNAVMGVMLASMLLCMVGLTEVLGLGATANAAHVGGLVFGLIWGGICGSLYGYRMKVRSRGV